MIYIYISVRSVEYFPRFESRRCEWNLGLGLSLSHKLIITIKISIFLWDADSALAF